MPTLLMVGTAGLFLMIGAASAESQTMVYRPAIDAIGNALPPAMESTPGIPDDIGFGPGESAPAGRGRVTVESGTPPPANGPFARRQMWEITR